MPRGGGVHLEAVRLAEGLGGRNVRGGGEEGGEVPPVGHEVRGEERRGASPWASISTLRGRGTKGMCNVR